MRVPFQETVQERRRPNSDICDEVSKFTGRRIEGMMWIPVEARLSVAWRIQRAHPCPQARSGDLNRFVVVKGPGGKWPGCFKPL